MMAWPMLGPVGVAIGIALNLALACWLSYFLLHTRGARRRAEAVWSQSESFRALFNHTSAGMALIDARGRITRCNGALQDILGYHDHELHGMTLTQLLHPADVIRHRAQFEALIEEQHESYQIEQRYLTIDGRSLRGRLTISIVRGASGRSKSPFAVAVIEDLTQHWQAEDELSATRAVIHDLYEVVVDQHLNLPERMRALLAIGCRRFNTETGVLGRICGEQFEVLQTISPDERVRRGQIYELSPVREMNGHTAPGQSQESVVASGAEYSTDWHDYPFFGVTNIETYLGAPIIVDGALYGTINFSSPDPRPRPFDDDDTELLRLMAQWIGGEIERRQARAELEAKQRELLEANIKLEALATTDGLTGTKNRRAFDERLEMEFQRSRRYGTPLSLLLLDVDKFKQYNDTFGHPAGDGVLKTVASLLQNNVRNIDFVARYGGEEFVILLPNTDQAGAMILAERLRSTIEAAPWKDRLVTASFGAATLTGDMKERDALTAKADAALYCSKTNGRNQVTHAHDMLDQLSVCLPDAGI